MVGRVCTMQRCCLAPRQVQEGTKKSSVERFFSFWVKCVRFLVSWGVGWGGVGVTANTVSDFFCFSHHLSRQKVLKGKKLEGGGRRGKKVFFLLPFLLLTDFPSWKKRRKEETFQSRVDLPAFLREKKYCLHSTYSRLRLSQNHPTGLLNLRAQQIQP